MILDHISRAEKYYHVHTSFRHAFDYLKQTNIAALENGRYDIEGNDIYLLVSRENTSNKNGALESHRKFIDIQVAVSGSFPLGWRNIDTCQSLNEPYNPEKDVQHYLDKPEFIVELTEGMFTVVFPEDAHAPMPPKDRVVKAVIKVAV